MTIFPALRLPLLFVSLLLSFLAPAAGSVKELHQTLIQASKAKDLSILEGLPHQMFERTIYERELQRKDLRKIADYPLYAEKSAPKQDKALRTFLQSRSIVVPYSGEKKCGGFHPDYALTWTDGQNRSHAALLCFGCGELLYVSPAGKPQRYDFAKDTKTTFTLLLQAHRKNRPDRE